MWGHWPGGRASSHSFARPRGEPISRCWLRTAGLPADEIASRTDVAAGRYYLDTSAYLCVLLGEAGWERIAREIESGHLLSSVLLALEAERTLVQLARGGRLSPPDLQAALDRLSVDLAQFMLRDLTLDLCRSRAMPIVSTPRSLDLAHLRTALWFHEQEVLTRFVSLDTGQIQGARELGLPV